MVKKKTTTTKDGLPPTASKKLEQHQSSKRADPSPAELSDVTPTPTNALIVAL